MLSKKLFCFFIPVGILLSFSCFSQKSETNFEDVNKLQLLQKYCQTKEDVWKFYNFEIRAFDLHAGETVADIGGFDGVWEGVFSVYSDSVIFYLEDISDKGFGRCDSIMTYCEKLKGRKNTNTIIKVTGTDSTTNLPIKKFDKVFCSETFHHFSNPEKMLNEIKTLLKPGGKLLIRDSVRKGKKNNPVHFHYSQKEIKDLLIKNGFEIKLDFSSKNMASFVLTVR